jgi:hypothetical protein
MNFGEFVILLVLSTVLFFVPIIVNHLFGHRGPAFNPNFQECPTCGAENDNTKVQCYCCGHDFGPSPLEGLNAALFQRVKQADEEKRQRRATPETSRMVTDKPPPSGQTKFRAD